MRFKKNIFIFVFLLIVVPSVLAWPYGFSYRRLVNISNTAGAQTDFQVAVDMSEVDLNLTGLVGSWHFDDFKAAPSKTTCQTIKAANPSATDGVYVVNPNGTSFQVYCDMTTRGGGWMLLDNFVSSNAGDSDPYGYAIGSSSISNESTPDNAGYNVYLTNYENSKYTKTSGYLQMFYSGGNTGYINKTLPTYANEILVKWGNWYTGTASLKIGGTTVQTLAANHGAAAYTGSYTPGDSVRFEESGIFWAGEVWVRESASGSGSFAADSSGGNNDGVIHGTNLTFQSAGSDDGNYGHLFVNGTDYSFEQRGINVIRLDGDGNFAGKLYFDTYGGGDYKLEDEVYQTCTNNCAAQKLDDWLNEVSYGDTVMMAVKDSAALNLNVTTAITNVLGSTLIGSLGFRDSWGIIGVVGEGKKAETYVARNSGPAVGVWSGYSDDLWTTETVEGYGMEFDGLDDYVEVEDSASLEVIGNLTIESWIYPKNIAQGRQGIVFKDYANEYEIIMESNGQISFYHGDGTYEEITEPTTVMKENKWNHLVITRTLSPKKIYFYLNGSYMGFADYTNTPTASANPVIIGERNNYNFNGTIDEVRIYNRTLSEAEINKSFCIGAYRLNRSLTESFAYPSWCDDIIKSKYYSWQDLRFTNVSGELKSGATFDHWLESDKKAWVKVPNLADNKNTTIYMNYGVSLMSSESDGNATFVLFDDFDDGSYINDWDVNSVNGASLVELRGNLKMIAGSSTHSGAGVSLKNTISNDNWTMEFSGKRDAGYKGGEPGLLFGFTDKTSQDTTYYGHWNNRADGSIREYISNSQRLASQYDDSGSYGTLSLETWDGKWVRGTVTYLHDDKKTSTRFRYGDTDTTIGPTSAGTTQLSSLYPQIHYGEYGQSGESASVDWIAIRKYASTEPSVSYMGSEETRPGHLNSFSVSNRLSFAGSGFRFGMNGVAIGS